MPCTNSLYLRTDAVNFRLRPARQSGEIAFPKKFINMAPQAATFVAEVAAVPPDEAPTGTKVPEPSTLFLLVGGMIAMSRVLRVRTQPKNLLRMAAARMGTPLQH